MQKTPTVFGCLGPDFEEVIAEIIEEQMQENHDSCTDKEQHITAFLEVEDSLRADMWSLLKKAEKELTQYRLKHDMRPFNWALETYEGVQSMLGLDKGQPRLARTIEKRQQTVLRKYYADLKKGESGDRACQEQNFPMLRRCTKRKPEYRGLHDPLAVNQVTREANPSPVCHSPQAIKALEVFAALSQRIIKNVQTHRLNH